MVMVYFHQLHLSFFITKNIIMGNARKMDIVTKWTGKAHKNHKKVISYHNWRIYCFMFPVHPFFSFILSHKPALK